MKSRANIIVVVGPTAAGKTAFAEELGLKLGGEIINADSQQFYRGFDIGTGKIPLAQRRIRHWFLDLCGPEERMTAVEFARRADQLIHELSSQGKIPIVVGGTGLYLKALLEGFDELPPRDINIRTQLKQELQEFGVLHLHERLKTLDPLSAAKISPQDSNRLLRYLEIASLTKTAPSTLMQAGRPDQLRYCTHTYWLHLERKILRQRIAQRVDAMLQAGWQEEVANLLEQGIDPRALEIRPIGYAELAAVVRGEMQPDAARQKIVTRTQQYAKRQETFFRKLLAFPAYSQQGSCLKIVNKR